MSDSGSSSQGCATEVLACIALLWILMLSCEKTRYGTVRELRETWDDIHAAWNDTTPPPENKKAPQ